MNDDHLKMLAQVCAFLGDIQDVEFSLRTKSERTPAPKLADAAQSVIA